LQQEEPLWSQPPPLLQRDLSDSGVEAEPVNGRYITPIPEDNEDYCHNCATLIRLAPTAKIEDRYWFHVAGLMRNCRVSDLAESGYLKMKEEEARWNS
jgi:hypothetical protein